MIVKLAHITFATREDEMQQVIENFAGYETQFIERELPNIEAKRQLFFAEHASHSLAKLDNKNNWPVEVVAYDSCYGISATHLLPDGRGVRIPTSNLDESLAFWKQMGFVEKCNCSDEVHMTGKFPMDHCAFELNLFQEDSFSNKTLDMKGIVAIAFAVTGLPQMINKLNSCGIHASQPEVLTIHGKELEIAFANSSTGDIVELIGIKR